MDWSLVHPNQIGYNHFYLEEQLPHFPRPLQDGLRSILSVAMGNGSPPPVAITEQATSQTDAVGGVFVVGPAGQRKSVPVRIRVELFPFFNQNHRVVLAFPFVWKWSLQDRHALERAVRLGLQLADASLGSCLPVAYLCPGFAAPSLFDPNLAVEGVTSLQVSLALAAYGAASKQSCPAQFFFTGEVLNDASIGDVGEVATKVEFLPRPEHASCVLVRPQANQETIPSDLQDRVQRASTLFHVMQMLDWRRPFGAYLQPLAKQSQIEDAVFGGVVPEDQLLPMRIQHIQDKKPIDVEHTELLHGTGLALLVGDPNNGKSSFLVWATQHLARISLSDSRPDTPLPVLLHLEDCFHYRRQSPKPLTWEQVLCEMVADQVKRPLHAIQGEMSRVVLFLDGWDRIRDQEFFSAILRWSSSGENPPRRIILASRSGMEPHPCPADVPVFYLADLQPQEVVVYLERRQRQAALRLYRSLEQRDMARRSPFTNRMFLRVLSEENTAPTTITSTGGLMVSLMQSSLHRLLRKGLEKYKLAPQPTAQPAQGLWRIASPFVSEKSRFDLLRPVCFYLADLQRRKPQAEFSQATIKKELRAWLQSDDSVVQDLVEYGVQTADLFDFFCDGACGLLVQQLDGTYRFRHDSFFDHCAANYLAAHNQAEIAALLQQGYPGVALYLGFLLAPEQLQQAWERCQTEYKIPSPNNIDINFVPTNDAVNTVRFFLQLVALREDAISLGFSVTGLAGSNSFYLRLDWRSLDEQTILLKQGILYLRESTGLSPESTEKEKREAVLQKPSAVRDLALALGRLGTVLGSLGHNAEAQKAHEESVLLSRLLCGLSESSPEGEKREAVLHKPSAVRDLALALHNLGTLQASQSQHRQAFQSLQEAVDYMRGLARLSAQSDLPTLQQRWREEPQRVQELLIVLDRFLEVCVALGESSLVVSLRSEIAHLKAGRP